MKKIVLLLPCLLLMSACSSQRASLAVQSFEHLNYPYKVKQVKLDDGKVIAYMDEGKGAQTLIFVHGLGSYAPAWKKNLAVLKKDFRCVALDLPGYGKSSKGQYDATMTAFANNLVAFMDHLKIDQAVLVGHSMGGQIATTVALQSPERVSQLVLLAPAGFETFSPEESQLLIGLFTAETVKTTTDEQIKTNLALNFHKMPEDATFMVDDRIGMRKAEGFDDYCYVVAACVRGMLNEPVYDQLGNIAQKTLVVFGENDALIPNRYLHQATTTEVARSGVEKMPNAELKMIPLAGHFVQFEKAAEVNSVISSFLK
ncbi:MAG: alpha/beta fold hydrolase [Bacteroidota bacterium]